MMAQPKSRYLVIEGDGSTREIAVGGRDEWALNELIEAGGAGCTPISHPGPRWSGYVHKLRRRHGLVVATITELHGGEFPGHHARYVLRSNVRPITDNDSGPRPPQPPRWEPEVMSGGVDG